MKKLRRFLKNESGAAEIVEAAIVYPIVIIAIFTLIYIGLYILQTVTVQSYAQKIALLASREVGRPGYVELIQQDKAVTSNAVELALQDYSESVTSGKNYGGLLLHIPQDSRIVRARAYRYWSGDPLDGSTKDYDPKSRLGKMLTKLVDKNSFLLGRRSADVKIECKNYFITQSVTVTVEQPVISSGFMEFFGVKTPTVRARAMCSATDIDEFVRNTNFVTDTLEMLAHKLNIDVDKVKTKLDEALQKIGLK